MPSRQIPDSQQKTDTFGNHTDARSESSDSKTEHDRQVHPDDTANSSEGGTDIETESFDESNFLDRLKNSTMDQVLKSVYGQDYKKIITNFDKFIELLTNATNSVTKNQFNATQQHEN